MNRWITIPFLLWITILFLLLLASQAGAATYYVVPPGTAGNTPTSPYDTWTNAANAISTVVTAGNSDTGGDGPHVAKVAPGTYDGGLVFTDTDWAEGSLITTVAVGSDTPATSPVVYVTSGIAHACYATVSM